MLTAAQLSAARAYNAANHARVGWRVRPQPLSGRARAFVDEGDGRLAEFVASYQWRTPGLTEDGKLGPRTLTSMRQWVAQTIAADGSAHARQTMPGWAAFDLLDLGKLPALTGGAVPPPRTTGGGSPAPSPALPASPARTPMVSAQGVPKKSNAVLWVGGIGVALAWAFGTESGRRFVRKLKGGAP